MKTSLESNTVQEIITFEKGYYDDGGFKFYDPQVEITEKGNLISCGNKGRVTIDLKMKDIFGE